MSTFTASAAEVKPATADWRAPALRIGMRRGVLELRHFFREKGQVVATFSLPVIMLTLMASIFHTVDHGLDTRQIYVTGMLAVGVMSSSFQSMALQVAAERRNGTLKRLRGTPMPAVSYFIGKIIMVLVSSVLQAAILLTLGTLAFGLQLPTDAGPWMTFAWVYLLGTTACTLLGIAYSPLQRAEGAAVVVLPFMFLQFVSGVYVVFADLPKGVQEVGAIFPLKWLCQGMRSVFLPEWYAKVEPAGTWEHGRMFLVLAVWTIGSLFLCVKSFQWKGVNDG